MYKIAAIKTIFLNYLNRTHYAFLNTVFTYNIVRYVYFLIYTTESRSVVILMGMSDLFKEGWRGDGART